MNRGLCAIVLWVAASWVAMPLLTHAQSKKTYDAEVLVIAASESPGKIDPALAKEPALKHRAFRGYRSMTLLKKHQVKLKPGQSVDLALPNGRHMQLEFEKELPDGRFAVKMAINRPKEDDYVRSVQMVLARNKPLFQAGQRLGDKDLILGIRIR